MELEYQAKVLHYALSKLAEDIKKALRSTDLLQVLDAQNALSELESAQKNADHQTRN